MVTNYKELKFWQTAFKVTKLVLRLVKKLPQNTATKIVISQLVRSSSSVGANIAEGYGRYRGKEYQRFLQTALGSANETEYWLLILKEIHSRFITEIDTIIESNNETIRMLVTSLNTLRKK